MKKSLKKQAIFPVLALLIVTALALIGSSFAWFAISQTSSVSTINSKTESGSAGLMISVDAATFGSTADLSSTNAVSKVLPTTMKQVSTNAVPETGSGKFGNFNFYQATVTSKNADATAKTVTTVLDDTVTYNAGIIAQATDKTASYIAFDLFFSVEKASTLFLRKSALSVITATNSINALRIAFEDMGATTGTGDAAAKKAAAIALVASESVKIWSSGTDSTFGFKAAATDVTPYINLTETDSVSSSDLRLTEATDYAVTVGEKSTKNIATLTEGQVNKLRVYIWFEGNDADCVISAAGDSVAVTLQFLAKTNEELALITA